MDKATTVAGSDVPASAAPYSLWQLVRYMLGLGTWGFGGPAALLGFMYRDLVEKRQWISEGDYKEGMTLAQLMPGPLAAQLAIYLGYVHYRIVGATLVGFSFVIPSFLMVVTIGAVYVAYGGISWMQAVFYGVGAAVTGIIAISAYKLTTRNIGKDRLLWAIFLASAAVTVVTKSEIVWLFLGAGVLVWLVRAPPKRSFGTGLNGIAASAPMARALLSGAPTGRCSPRSAATSSTREASSSAAAWRSCRSSTAASFRSTTGSMSGSLSTPSPLR